MMDSLSYKTDKLSFTLHRRQRKTMMIRLHPDMLIEVLAPTELGLDKIYEWVQKKTPWILRKINLFKQSQPLRPKPLYQDGEIHLYLGQQYHLKIEHCVKSGVAISDNAIVLSSHFPNKPMLTKKLLDAWFIKEAKEKFDERLRLALQLFQNPETVAPKMVNVRRLSSRWGSMSSRGSMTLNARLIHASIECIDYVIVHELCHRIHFHHGKEFWDLVQSLMPDWKNRKKKLRFELC